LPKDLDKLLQSTVWFLLCKAACSTASLQQYKAWQVKRLFIAQPAQMQVCLPTTTEKLAHRLPLLDLLVTLHLHLVLVQNSLQLAPGLLEVIVHLGQPLHTVSHSSATQTQQPQYSQYSPQYSQYSPQYSQYYQLTHLPQV